MAYQTLKVGKALIVKIPGDPENDPGSLDPDLIGRMASRGEAFIVLDLEKVPHFTSVAINCLVRALRRVREEGGELALVNVSAEILKVLTVIHIIGKLKVYDSIEGLRISQEQKPGRSPGSAPPA